MANINEILTWALGVGANIEPQPNYAVDTAQNLGVSAGTATSALYNKQARQSAFVASSIATFINQLAQVDVRDDGNVANFVGNFIQALTAHLQIHQGTNTQAFTTHGVFTFTVPANVFRIRVRGLVGAGGGGGGGEGASTWSSGGGGSGGYCEGYITVTPGQVLVVTVGQGGIGAAQGNGSTATPGGTTSVGAFMSATGGTGGTGGVATSSGGAPGVGSGASELNLFGANGGDGNNGSNASLGGAGGASAFGGGGRTSTLNNSTVNGLAPGSGGGGIWGTGQGAQTGGNGADGAVYFEWST